MDGFNMQYQSRTPVINAVQYICPSDNTSKNKIEECFDEFPEWLRIAFKFGIVIDRGSNLEIKRAVYCRQKVYETDWIICSIIPGEPFPELYLCETETFLQIYKEVNKNEK